MDVYFNRLLAFARMFFVATKLYCFVGFVREKIAEYNSQSTATPKS